MKILYVRPDLLDAAWAHAAPWIEKAGVRGNGRYPIDDYKDDILQGKKHLVKFVDGDKFAWVIAGVMQNSDHKTCVLSCIAGVGALEMLEDINNACLDFARHNDCKYIIFSGRKGWEREVAKIGWKPLNICYGREV